MLENHFACVDDIVCDLCGHGVEVIRVQPDGSLIGGAGASARAGLLARCVPPSGSKIATLLQFSLKSQTRFVKITSFLD